MDRLMNHRIIYLLLINLVCFDSQSFVDELEDQSAKTEKLLSTNKNLQDMNKALLIQVRVRHSMARVGNFVFSILYL